MQPWEALPGFPGTVHAHVLFSMDSFERKNQVHARSNQQILKANCSFSKRPKAGLLEWWHLSVTIKPVRRGFSDTTCWGKLDVSGMFMFLYCGTIERIWMWTSELSLQRCTRAVVEWKVRNWKCHGEVWVLASAGHRLLGGWSYYYPSFSGHSTPSMKWWALDLLPHFEAADVIMDTHFKHSSSSILAYWNGMKT